VGDDPRLMDVRGPVDDERVFGTGASRVRAREDRPKQVRCRRDKFPANASLQWCRPDVAPWATPARAHRRTILGEGQTV